MGHQVLHTLVGLSWSMVPSGWAFIKLPGALLNSDRLATGHSFCAATVSQHHLRSSGSLQDRHCNLTLDFR